MIEGVSIDKFKDKFSKDINDVYGEIINKNKKLGLLDEKNGRIYLTDKGIEVSNWVMSEFIL